MQIGLSSYTHRGLTRQSIIFIPSVSKKVGILFLVWEHATNFNVGKVHLFGGKVFHKLN